MGLTFPKDDISLKYAARHGVARPGKARPGKARPGVAGRGKAGAIQRRLLRGPRLFVLHGQNVLQ